MNRITPTIERAVGQAVVSFVLPLYNEAAVLRELVARISEAICEIGYDYEIVFCNDGSTDQSARLLDEIACADSHVRVVHLSRNFGHQAALHAGLAHARGDAVIVMDSDMQDDPAAISLFLEQWRNGFDVVYAERTKRKENVVKRCLFFSFSRGLNLISDTPIPNDAGNFGLIDRSAVAAMADMAERDRYFPGLRRWVGFRQTGVVVERLARYDEEPRVSLRGLFRLAKSAVFSFSSAPLTMFYGIAGLSGVVCLSLIAYAFYHRLVTGYAIPGWTSMVAIASFFGALNALGISILGEYVIRIYDQVRSRPQYLVSRRVNFDRAGDTNSDGTVLDWLDESVIEAVPSVPQS